MEESRPAGSWERKRRLIEVIVAWVRVDTVEDGGVEQGRATVTYRFSHPDQAMPLALSHSYSTGRVVRIPTQVKTVGDYIRKKRLGLKLLQKDVAVQLGVDKTSVFNWEGNRSSPEIRYMPAIIQFLGYDPLPLSETWPDRVLQARISQGLTQRRAAGE